MKNDVNEQEYFIDDRVIIPDDIKRMTPEQLQAEIDKFEREAKEKKLNQNKKTA